MGNLSAKDWIIKGGEGIIVTGTNITHEQMIELLNRYRVYLYETYPLDMALHEDTSFDA